MLVFGFTQHYENKHVEKSTGSTIAVTGADAEMVRGGDAFGES